MSFGLPSLVLKEGLHTCIASDTTVMGAVSVLLGFDFSHRLLVA